MGDGATGFFTEALFEVGGQRSGVPGPLQGLMPSQGLAGSTA